ncbi:MAG TPA: toluene-4-monooxygenase system B family protein [Polyangia bacterium]
MAQIPLTSSFEGDFVVKLVVANSLDTMDRLAEIVAAQTVGRSVRPRTQGVLRVRKAGGATPYPRWATLRNVGLLPMEAIEVFYADSDDDLGGHDHADAGSNHTDPAKKDGHA